MDGLTVELRTTFAVVDGAAVVVVVVVVDKTTVEEAVVGVPVVFSATVED